MNDPASFVFTGIDVVPARPGRADLRNLAWLRGTEPSPVPEQVYVVRIHVEGDLPTTGAGLELYLGDYRVRKFNPREGGLWFKVFNPRFFRKHAGRAVRVAVEGQAPRDTGLVLPELPPPGVLVSVDEAVRR